LGWKELETRAARLDAGATYQIAHDDLAVNAASGGSLAECRLCRGAASGLGRLLDTTDGSSRGRAADGASLSRAAAGGAALGRSDLIERLVELARHCERRFGLRGSICSELEQRHQLVRVEITLRRSEWWMRDGDGVVVEGSRRVCAK
jgi:hypothetical protein